MAWGVKTYTDAIRREDLLAVIADIEPKPKSKKKENDLWKKLQILL